jgi:hypothetical protein
MFDINTVINSAIATAVAEAIAPLVERIKVLEFDTQTLRIKIDAMETKLAEAALFTQTTSVTVPVDEAKMVEALNSQEWFWEKVGRFVTDNSRITVEDLHMVQRRVTALEDARYQGALSRSDVEAIVDHALDNHCETYDHDQYDEVYNEWGGEEASEFVKDSDIEDKINDTVNDILRNATFSISL